MLINIEDARLLLRNGRIIMFVPYGLRNGITSYLALTIDALDRALGGADVTTIESETLVERIRDEVFTDADFARECLDMGIVLACPESGAPLLGAHATGLTAQRERKSN